MKRSITLSTLAVTAALAAAGCGGSTQAAVTSHTTTSAATSAAPVTQTATTSAVDTTSGYHDATTLGLAMTAERNKLLAAAGITSITATGYTCLPTDTAHISFACTAVYSDGSQKSTLATVSADGATWQSATEQ